MGLNSLQNPYSAMTQTSVELVTGWNNIPTPPSAAGVIILPPSGNATQIFLGFGNSDPNQMDLNYNMPVVLSFNPNNIPPSIWMDAMGPVTIQLYWL
jgi:hypothetical protein